MPTNKTLNILCIEDNAGEARLMERYLSRAGHMMAWAKSGSEGLSRQLKENFDIVLVDHLLPDMKGLVVLRKLIEHDPHLPVIMVTANGDEETAVSAMKLGAKDYIIKDPYGGFTELLPAVIEQAHRQYVTILEKQQAEKAIQNREAILTVVANAAEQLLKNPTWQAGITDIMAQLGQASNVTRVTIFENETTPNKNIIIKSYNEWLKPSTIHPFGKIVGKTYGELNLDRWIQSLQDGDPVFGQIQHSDYPKQSILDADWPRSYILMPIFTDLDWWGFIGFDDENLNRRWNRVEVEALKTAANILGAALQRKLTEATLYQAQKLESIGLLAGGIAHDFNNLLTAILSQTSLSLHKIPPDHTIRPHLEKVIETSDQAADLVKQLLGYSGQGQYQVEPLNLNDVLNENMSLFNTISRARVKVHLEMAPDISAVEADRNQIQQVMMNLMINAIESVEGTTGTVRIATSDIYANNPIHIIGRQVLPPGQYVCLNIKDNGSGIKPELVTKIFDPFFSTKSKGRGLGLSATLGIIQAHGGGLQVVSSEGQGTDFFVYLPASQKVARVQPELKSFKGKLEATILIIDDEPTVLEPLTDGLELLGAEVFAASNGFEAIEIYKAHHQEIDIIILDMIMPGMGGRETFVHLQQINPGLKVILSSGYSEVELLRQFADGEIKLFLKKPYRFEKLIGEINQALQ